ncbi:uncharacterized protein LOC120221671 isoform X2 [Hyaena hyaena]|uniref:uncharacterized protein LOC120221671 isoform X2 n=1 Tax=Hyaena hyaena TaxID=95912 RepID=UPI0019206E28|nr:uncharacterized protein LOC120221671 isoform X2 [Hyaena hyaena]
MNNQKLGLTHLRGGSRNALPSIPRGRAVKHTVLRLFLKSREQLTVTDIRAPRSAARPPREPGRGAEARGGGGRGQRTIRST